MRNKYTATIYFVIFIVMLATFAIAQTSPTYDTKIPPAYEWGSGSGIKPQQQGTPEASDHKIIANISVDTKNIDKGIATLSENLNTIDNRLIKTIGTETLTIADLVKEIADKEVDLSKLEGDLEKVRDSLANASETTVLNLIKIRESIRDASDTTILDRVKNVDSKLETVIGTETLTITDLVKDIASKEMDLSKLEDDLEKVKESLRDASNTTVLNKIEAIDSKLTAEIGSETNSIAQMFADNASSTAYPWDAYFYWGTEGYPQDDAFLVPRNMVGLMCNLMDMLMFNHSAGDDSYTFETFPTALFREYYDAADDQMKYFSLIDTLMRWKTDEESGNEEPVYISSDVASIAATLASTAEQLDSISDKLTFKEETESGTVEHDINEALFANSKSSGSTVPLCNVLMGEVSGSGETIGEMTTKILSSVFQEESSSAEATSVLKEFKNINNASDSIIVTSANNIVTGLQTEIASVAAAVASVAAKIEEVNTTSAFTTFAVSLSAGTPTKINAWANHPDGKHRQYVELTAPSDDDVFYISNSSTMTINNSRRCRGRIMLRLHENADLYVLSTEAVNLIQTEGY